MTFDSLTIDTVNRTSRAHEFASGKSTNVARVLHTLGEKAMAVSFVGGHRGRAFREDLLAAGIGHDLIEVEPQTRMAITLIDQANGTATELIEEPAHLRESDYDAMLAVLSKHLPAARMMVISGTLPPGAGPDFYARCVKLAEPKMQVILDAVGEPLLAALEYRPLVVKPNRTELGRTLGIDVNSDDAVKEGMRELIQRGARWVVVTQGPKPALVADGTSFWHAITPPVKAISPIGSGDAFAAGLAAAIVRGDKMPGACALAVASGAANALTADAGHVDPVEVRRISNSVFVRPS